MRAYVVNPGTKRKSKSKRKRHVSRKTKARIRRAARRRAAHRSRLACSTVVRKSICGLSPSKLAAAQRSCRYPSKQAGSFIIPHRNPGGLGSIKSAFSPNVIKDTIPLAIGAFGNSYLTNQVVTRFTPTWNSGLKRAAVSLGTAGAIGAIAGFAGAGPAAGAFVGALTQSLIRLYDDMMSKPALPMPPVATTVKGFGENQPIYSPDYNSLDGLSETGDDDDGLSGLGEDEDQFQS